MLSHYLLAVMLAQPPALAPQPQPQEGWSAGHSIAQTESVPQSTTGYTSGSPLADINGDGVLDIFDVIAFINCVNTGAACADLNGDGVIDIFDVQLFIAL
ncbi:MAG: hypothetical protein KC996_04680 [Phycisphaerales bacterium]|nr:hypothetical protein [Phycisphaerales bacterium]